jgi:hypothetical protein
MDEKKHPDGPLHLQRSLTECTEALVNIIRQSVDHPVTLIRSLHCECMPSGIMRAVKPPQTTIEQRTAPIRQKNIESSRRMKVEDGSTPDKPASGSERRLACRFFALQLNDEEGVVHSLCRRCNKLVLLYDRALYWGIKRQSRETPETFPYKCSCGGHAFEVGVAFEYPDEALDENDLTTITIAVRCASCGEMAVVFDDEAT